MLSRAKILVWSVYIMAQLLRYVHVIELKMHQSQCGNRQLQFNITISLNVAWDQKAQLGNDMTTAD